MSTKKLVHNSTRALLFCLACSVLPVNATCDFSYWLTYNNTKIYKNNDGTAYIYRLNDFSVDVDGAPNAYHPSDAGKACRSHKKFIGIDCLDNAKYNYGKWQNVIVPDPLNSDKGYIQKSGAYKGYFISQSALKDFTKSNIDISKYVNATEIPYITFPGNFNSMKGTGLLGDFGYAINTSNGKESSFIVGDVGNANDPLEEISIFLAAELGGKNPNPRTGSGLPVGNIVFVVFPYSHKIPAWPVSIEEINSSSLTQVMRVGGKSKILECYQNTK